MIPQTFIFFGPSGSGKGTQAKLLMEKIKALDAGTEVLYLETGHKLREFAEGQSLSAINTKNILENGGLMPEFVPIWVWTDFFIHNLSGEEHLVIDGIARREHEAWILDGAMKFYGRKPNIISIKTSSKWATERLKERGRVDDKTEEIKRRMEWYEKNTVPAINHFRNNSEYKFVEVNGEQSIEDVHKEILSKTGLI